MQESWKVKVIVNCIKCPHRMWIPHIMRKNNADEIRRSCRLSKNVCTKKNCMLISEEE